MRKSLHRHLWQRLPHRYRRKALFIGTAAIAPRPLQGVRPAEPVIVVGAFRTASGLGESTRLCYDTLKATGVPIFGIDLTAGLMQPIDYPDLDFADGRHIQGPGTLILHVNSPLVPLALCRLGRNLVRDKYVVGCWAWELPHVPPDWCYGVPFVHEIWTPSTFTATAVSEISDGRPVRVVPYAVALHQRQTADRVCVVETDRPFTALLIFNMASSFARKNPLATIAAFQRAFGDDDSSRLIIKTSNGNAYPDGINALNEAVRGSPNIVLIDRTMTRAEIETLYQQSNVIVSLHRSEGFGLTLAEGMLRGLPVIATNWSGNVDFLHPDNSLTVPYRLVPAADSQGTYDHPGTMWAEPDIDAAAAALQRLRREPELARGLGQAAAAYGERIWSADHYADSVRSYLGL